MANPTNSEMRRMETNCVVGAIIGREDDHDIHNKLFDRLFGTSISQWIETRPDRNVLYQDLFDHALAEINACNPTQGQEQQQFTPTCRSTGILLEEVHNVPDTGSPCKYLAPYNVFEPQPSGIGTWVPMFMTKEEIYSIAPDMGLLDKDISERLLGFTQYLSPTYICFRLELILKAAETERNFAFPDMKSAENLVRAWKGASGSSLRKGLIKTLAAVSCFSHFRQFGEAVVRSQLLGDPRSMSQYFEDSACAIFAKLDDGSQYQNTLTEIEEHWRRVKNLGENIAILARNLGGEGFVLLFPFRQLEVMLGKRLISFHSTNALWRALGDLLYSTEMGSFFKSMANSIGISLIDLCYGEPSPSRHEILERLDTIRRQYSLSPVSKHTPRLTENMLVKEPDSIPFVFCGSLEARHLAPSLSLRPLSLLQFVGGHLKPEIVEYLIQQQLPRGWAVLGREDISHPATKELLLCDYQGIMIPLCIDNGWVLVCYTNPVRSEADYFIQFINPTWSYERYLVASKMIAAWIPRNAPWIPQQLKWQSVQPVDSRNASETDSGIHIIIDAIAMAKTGKPESRLLNEQICKGLRIKYFVLLLNALQETVNKGATKNTHENTRVKTETLPGS
ncbi:hypothetical protein F5B21DRAFT_362397 [Xylaria acuta]|nr:hypothetical protein F5B21DRAFT_362397 [Xylaria acuta]